MLQQQHGIREIKTDDGRSLAVEITGAATGTPVFLLHGTPGSRNGPKPRSSVLYRQGVRLITYDRPGYGGSARCQGRRVADAAADVAAIAREFGISEFGVVGRSGGGPHALACAALLGTSVIRTLVLVSVAPADAHGLNWFDGMAPGNTDEYTTADADATALVEHLSKRAEQIRDDPRLLLNELRDQITAPDERVIRDTSIRGLLAKTYHEALRGGPYGWIDDVFALRNDWGFDLASITSPVLLWHGEIDNFSPVGHTRWLAKRMTRANPTVRVEPDAAHFGAVEILPDLLNWVVGRVDADEGSVVVDPEPPARTIRART